MFRRSTEYIFSSIKIENFVLFCFFLLRSLYISLFLGYNKYIWKKFTPKNTYFRPFSRVFLPRKIVCKRHYTILSIMIHYLIIMIEKKDVKRFWKEFQKNLF